MLPKGFANGKLDTIFVITFGQVQAVIVLSIRDSVDHVVSSCSVILTAYYYVPENSVRARTFG